MTDFPSLTVKECADFLLKVENPLIIMHVRPDGDTVGSCAALMRMLGQLGKRARYACSDTIPERLTFLLEGLDKASEMDFSGYTVIAIDVPSAAQIGDIIDKIPAPSLMIDHHEIGVPYAPNYIIKGESSAGEVLFTVAEELIERGLAVLDKALAYSLYASISSDTGCFRYSNTTPDTLRRAARLIETGIDAADINHRLFNAKSERQLRAEGYTAENIVTALSGKVAYSTVTKAERDRLGVLMEHFETAIDIVRSVIGVEISFVIKETDKGEYKVSLRSTGADVARISASFGGGGHIRAAGCTVIAENIDAAAKTVLEKIENEYYK